MIGITAQERLQANAHELVDQYKGSVTKICEDCIKSGVPVSDQALASILHTHAQEHTIDACNDPLVRRLALMSLARVDWLAIAKEF